jgi:hypothetical protein
MTTTTAAKKTARPEVAETSTEVVEKVATLAGQSLDKAQETANKATEVAHGNVQIFDAAAGAMRSGMVEMQLKAIEIAQANTDAAFSFLRDLLAVRDPQGLVKANVDFVSRQSAELARQVRELNEVTAKCARETTRPAQDGLARSFAELTKNFAA